MCVLKIFTYHLLSNDFQRPWGGTVFFSSFGLLCVCSEGRESRRCAQDSSALSYQGQGGRSSSRRQYQVPQKQGQSLAKLWIMFQLDHLSIFPEKALFYLMLRPLTHRLPLKPFTCSSPLITDLHRGPPLTDKEGVLCVLDSSPYLSSSFRLLWKPVSAL